MNPDNQTIKQPVSHNERVWATFCHLSSFAFFLLPFIGHIVGPMVIWIIKKDESTFIDKEARESINFQISVTIYFIISFILTIFLIGFVFLAVLIILWLVSPIVAAIRSNNGEHYVYPMTIRFF